MKLSTKYLGKRFENPFVLASGPPTASLEMISRAFDAGWAGAVIKTLVRVPVHNLHNRFATHQNPARPEVDGGGFRHFLCRRSRSAGGRRWALRHQYLPVAVGDRLEI